MLHKHYYFNIFTYLPIGIGAYEMRYEVFVFSSHFGVYVIFHRDYVITYIIIGVNVQNSRHCRSPYLPSTVSSHLYVYILNMVMAVSTGFRLSSRCRRSTYNDNRFHRTRIYIVVGELIPETCLMYELIPLLLCG